MCKCIKISNQLFFLLPQTSQGSVSIPDVILQVDTLQLQVDLRTDEGEGSLGKGAFPEELIATHMPLYTKSVCL